MSKLKEIHSPDPWQIAQTKLYFMNLLNEAGPHDKPAAFTMYASAQAACPLLAQICEKLTHREREFMIKRVENKL